MSHTVVGEERGWRTTVATVGAGSILALLPKCPACIAAYVGLVSGGLGATGGIAGDPHSLGAVYVLVWGGFGLALAGLAWRSFRKRAFGPLVVALAGAGLLALSRAEGVDVPPAVGLAGLVIGTIWSARLPRRTGSGCHG